MIQPFSLTDDGFGVFSLLRPHKKSLQRPEHFCQAYFGPRFHRRAACRPRKCRREHRRSCWFDFQATHRLPPSTIGVMEPLRSGLMSSQARQHAATAATRTSRTTADYGFGRRPKPVVARRPRPAHSVPTPPPGAQPRLPQVATPPATTSMPSASPAPTPPRPTLRVRRLLHRVHHHRHSRSRSPSSYLMTTPPPRLRLALHLQRLGARTSR